MSEVDENVGAPEKIRQVTTHDDIVNRHGYHKATEETIESHKKIRGVFIEIGDFLNDIVPEGREKSLMYTALQEASMWANASVACNKAPLDLNG